jgi:hypothetical protein
LQRPRLRLGCGRGCPGDSGGVGGCDINDPFGDRRSVGQDAVEQTRREQVPDISYSDRYSTAARTAPM